MDDIVEIIRGRIHAEFDGECHLADTEAHAAADLIESLRSDISRLTKERDEARKAAKDIEKKAMWLRGDTAYREFPAFVTNRLRAAIRQKSDVPTSDDLPEGGA
jgi:hypothetical protein